MNRFLWLLVVACLLAAPAQAALYVMNSNAANNYSLLLQGTDALYIYDLNLTVTVNATTIIYAPVINTTVINSTVGNCSNGTVFQNVSVTNTTIYYLYNNATCDALSNQTFVGINDDRKLASGEVAQVYRPDIGLRIRYECQSIVQQEIQRTLAPGETANLTGCGSYQIKASDNCPVQVGCGLSQAEFCSNYTPPGFIAQGLCLNSSNGGYNNSAPQVYYNSTQPDNTQWYFAGAVIVALGYFVWKRAQTRPAQSISQGGVV